MPLPNSGQVSLDDIATEFGGDQPHQLSEYHGEGNSAASGEIQVSEFHGASAEYEIQALLVAGGGGGGGNRTGSNRRGPFPAGGGGAGGVRLGNIISVQGGDIYPVVVGSQGNSNGIRGNGNNGGTSSFGGVNATGGGRGGSIQNEPGDGGSGGGGGFEGNAKQSPGNPVSGQGHEGGNADRSSSRRNNAGMEGGGGGGKGNEGHNSEPGNGAVISGWDSFGTMGTGGHGQCCNENSPRGNDGTDQKGGGGGFGAHGGNGVVIVRYSGNTQKGTGGVVSFADGYVYHKFSNSGNFDA